MDATHYNILEIAIDCADVSIVKKSFLDKCSRESDTTVINRLKEAYNYVKARVQLLQNEQLITDKLKKLNEINDQTRSNRRELSGQARQYPKISLDNATPLKYSNPFEIRSAPTSKSIPDFTQQIKCDNAVLGDNFDVDKTYEDMMRYRSTTTNYQTIDQPKIENPLRNQKFCLSKFNELFEENNKKEQQKIQDLNLECFGGFDELGGAASIISDGQYMFVNGGTHNFKGSYDYLDENPIYEPSAERVPTDNLDLVTDSELINYTDIVKTSSFTNKKPTKKEFDDQLQNMYLEQVKKSEEDRLRNKKVIEEYMKDLSFETKTKLKNFK